MTDICLIRHAKAGLAQSQLDADGRWNPDLSPDGWAQAEALADRLASHEWAAVWASPLSRAVQTADAVAAACDLRVQLDARLAEFHRGAFECADPRGVPGYAAHWRQGAWSAWPDGETRTAFRSRILGVVDDLRATFPSERVAVVTHGGVISELLAVLTACRPGVAFRSDLTSVTRLVLHDNQVLVGAFNDVWHLEDALSLPLAPRTGRVAP